MKEQNSVEDTITYALGLDTNKIHEIWSTYIKDLISGVYTSEDQLIRAIEADDLTEIEKLVVSLIIGKFIGKAL